MTLPLSHRFLTRARRRLRRVVRAAAITSAVGYTAALLFLYCAQEWMIFPGHAYQGSAAEPPRDATSVSLTTAHGHHLTAWWAPAASAGGSPLPSSARRLTLLYFYGNGTYLATCAERVDAFRRLGVDVLIPEFVGYGMSDGTPSEQGCYDTADAAFDYLTRTRRIPAGRIVAAGGSLGGAVAIDLAARQPVAGLATFSTFTSMVEMSRRNVPFMPVSLLLRHRFESETKIRRVTCPVFLSHGTADEVIPFGMRDRLAAAARGPVTTFTIPGAGHNDFFSVGGEGLMSALGVWLHRLQV